MGLIFILSAIFIVAGCATLGYCYYMIEEDLGCDAKYIYPLFAGAAALTIIAILLGMFSGIGFLVSLL